MSKEESDRARLRRFARVPFKVVVPTAAALGAGAAVAIGSIPGPDGTITGCYYTIPADQGGDYPYGSLRVIDPSQTTATDPDVYSCNSNEHTITWNQQGPMGPQGQTGAQGQTGPQGQPGQPAQILGESTFSMQSNKLDKVYLELGGVPGDTSKGDVKGLIPVESFALGAGGAITGETKVTISSFEVTKKADDASNSALFHDYGLGTKIQSGKVIIMDKKGSVITYEFEGIVISGFSEGASSGAVPTESISFDYSKIKTVYGQGKSQVSTGFSSGKTIGYNISSAATK